MTVKLVRILAFMPFLVFGSAVHSQIHYVSNDGDNIYPCATWETAAHRIQDAVDAAADEGGQA